MAACPAACLERVTIIEYVQMARLGQILQLQVPTMVMRGHRDIVFDRPLFEKVAGSIPGAEDIDIPCIRPHGHVGEA
jgi:pimeloyl-ACP methyl ester carboxylesterase